MFSFRTLRWSIPLFVLTLALSLAFWPLGVRAGTITVDGTTCTLPNAISAANVDVTVGGCTISGSTGTDTLLLTAPTYSLSYNALYAADGDVNSTPSITTTLIISSNVVGGSTLQRTGGSNARLLHVGTAGNLTLMGVTVKNGNSGGSNGGGIFTRGKTSLINTTLFNNVATSGGGLANSGTVTLTAVTIFSNRATSNGGGLYNNNNGKIATLISSDVISNSANSTGGGIYNNNGGSTVTLTDTLLLSNTANSNGGGIYVNNNGSKVSITNSELRANKGQSGGSLYINSSSSALLTNTLILSNTATNQGGGLALSSSTSVIMTKTVISGNRAGSGGGLFSFTNSSVNVTITNGRVFSNTATGQGGGLYNGTNANLINTPVISNQAGGDGGGIYGYVGGTTTLTGSDLIGNRSGGKGGALYAGQTVSLTDSDVLSNTATNEGGGIYIFRGGGNSLTLTNSDLVANYAIGNGGGIYSGLNVTLTDSDVISNTSRTGRGGGIYTEDPGGANINLTNSDVTRNYAGSDGGGINSTMGLTLLNSDMFSNTSLGKGGGAFISDNGSSVGNFTNSNVYANKATGDGGGIYTGMGITLNNSDVTSNTSSGSGGGIYTRDTSSGNTNLTNSDVIANQAAQDGGGLYVGSNTMFLNSKVLSNTASGSGGGLYNNGPALFTGSSFIANVASGRGGGLFNAGGGEAELNNTDMIANSAITNGGGLYNNALVTLANSDILSNTTQGNGGGLYNNAIATIADSQINANSAITNGGGLYGTYSSATAMTTTFLIANSAGVDGGGLYNNRALTVSNTQILSNTALGNGGGIHSNGDVTVTLSALIGNQATLSGGGYYAGFGLTTILQSRILANEAGDSGGVFILGTATINQSCIVDNTDVAVTYSDNNTLEATNNWWGAPDGPAGVGTGAGDSVGSDVTFSPFATSALLDCDPRSADIAMTKSVAPSGNLLPGQPLTFTVVITNNDTLNVHNLRLVDASPTGFILSETISAGTGITAVVGGFRIPSLEAGDVATLTVRGTVSSTLSADTILTNTAVVTNSLLGLTATASAPIKVPVLSWSQDNYFANEDAGTFTATVVLSPTNPYASVTAQAGVPNTENLTFAPGIGSQPVGVPITDDAIILPRTLFLTLLSSAGAAIDALGGDEATVALVEDDAAPALAVQKVANTAQAYVGELITYTYRITNTGNVTLSVSSATDDQLGALAGLAGQLNMLGTDSATLTYTVQAGNLPGPLVNTVTVVSTDDYTHVITSTASFTVTLIEPLPALVVEKRASASQAFVGDTITYTYHLTNTGNITVAVAATDDKVGAVAGLVGQLAPLGTDSATLTYTVQAGDLPGPLVNTVTVTGTDRFGNEGMDDDSASVTVIEPLPALVVEKSASASQAYAGDTITYTYRLTNTGNITLTVDSATDNQLGAVAGLVGQLAPLGTDSATLTYVVQTSDLPGPLVNTVTVTGTDRFGNEGMDDDSASVTLVTPVVKLSKRASTPSNLLPGQPLTYTVTITNEEANSLENFTLRDVLPPGFVLSAVNTTGPTFNPNGSSYEISQLLASQVATIEFVGAVDSTLTADLSLSNTATLTQSLIGTLTASTSNEVVVPVVNWSDDEYVTDEASGTFTATLLMSPINPYASVSVNVIITDSSPSTFAAAEVQTITFPPGSGSQEVVVSITNDGVVLSRTITLLLQSLSGAALGEGANGTLATITLVEANDAPAIAVAASVNTTQADVGDTIIYTYLITNTGNVTLTTVSAESDSAGAVAGLDGLLAPNATRTVTQSYVVLGSDSAQPLVSTVTATGVDVFGTVVTANTTTTVTVNDPTALPEMEQPGQSGLQIYLPRLGAD